MAKRVIIDTEECIGRFRDGFFVELLSENRFFHLSGGPRHGRHSAEHHAGMADFLLFDLYSQSQASRGEIPGSPRPYFAVGAAQTRRRRGLQRHIEDGSCMGIPRTPSARLTDCPKPNTAVWHLRFSVLR
jgi:hypothetical protein